MRGIITARSPNNEDNSSAPHTKALQPQFAVVLAVVFYRDHGKVKDGLEVCEIDSMPSEVFSTFRLVPRDHAQNVYAIYSPVKQVVDSRSGGGVFQMANVRVERRAARRRVRSRTRG